jgi:RNA polymerase sigma-70 factor (ECF subfamily)
MTETRKAEDRSRLFEDLLSHREDVYRICLGFSRNTCDAEELAQEVYLKAYKKMSSLENSGLAKEWLFRITRNTCLDHKKRRRFFRFIELGKDNEPQERETPDTLFGEREQTRILKEIIRALPRKQKEVLILREYGDLSYKELARTLGIKEGTVMSRLNRARRIVTNQMEKKGHGTKP